jgi:hypothetical protein
MMEDFNAVFAEIFDATSTRLSVGDPTNIPIAKGIPEDTDFTQRFFAEMLGDPLAHERSTGAGDLICAKAEFEDLKKLLIAPAEDEPRTIPTVPTSAPAFPALRNRDTMNKRAKNLTRQDLSARMSKHYHHGLWREWETMMKSCIGDAEFDERKALSFLVG